LSGQVVVINSRCRTDNRVRVLIPIGRYVHPTAEHKRNAMLRYDEILKGEKKQTEQEGRPN
jgi:hypothetical protein